jgi:hypothetical protein
MTDANEIARIERDHFWTELDRVRDEKLTRVIDLTTPEGKAYWQRRHDAEIASGELGEDYV